jgi:uncharacterized protein (UPF0332 family)
MTDEQRGLLLKAKESLRAAELLLNEGHADFAAARAYYAMFYVAEALLLGEELSFSKHSAVNAAFGRTFVATQRIPSEFHRFLLDAFTLRNAADYEVGPGLDEKVAQEQIEHARKFIELGEQMLGPAVE